MNEPPHSSPEDFAQVYTDLLLNGREEIHARHRQGAGGIEVTRRLSDLVDRIITSIYRLAVERHPGPGEPGITVAATGGYGRRRLAPFSDIDVTFIVAEEDDPRLDGIAREMFFLIGRIFTDGAGLKVGYGYRAMRDAQDLDVQTQTALLDSRLVAGDRALFYRFREEFIRHILPGVFLWHKMDERRTAMQEVGDAVYRTEPNVKLGAGGLRDLHTAEWLVKSTMGSGLEDPWGRLRSIGYINDDEFRSITKGREFLLRVRNAMHWMAGRPLDVITSDRQAALAEDLGYKDSDSGSAAERMMGDYYLHAANIQRIARKVTSKCARHPLKLGDGLVLKEGQITPTNLTFLDRTPSAALGVLHIAQKYGFPLSSQVEEMIGDFAARGDTLLDDPDSTRIFIQILQYPHNVYSALRAMADLGVLPLVLPAYTDLLRFMPAEPAHSYTVGEHSLRVVQELEKMRADPEPENALCREVFAGLDRPEVLILAALLHDVGKIQRRGRHGEIGAQMARTIGRQLGLDDDAVEVLAFLVREHPLMPRLSRSRDPEQPETVAELLAKVPNPEDLPPLFLLSTADLRTFGHDAWIHVQLEFLARLFIRAEKAVSRPESVSPSAEAIQSDVSRVQRQLSRRNLEEKVVKELCESMPAAYLLNNDVDTIVRHLQMLERLAGGPVVHFADGRRRPWTVLTVAAADQPGLLARIAGVLWAHDVNVHSARVYTREGDNPVALDELLVDAHNRPLPLSLRLELERDLRAVLGEGTSLSVIFARRGRLIGPASAIRSVHLHNDMSETYTVVEVEMPDEKGLLYRLASAMSAMGWIIHNARIGTRAGEARDVFYVTDAEGRKIDAGNLDFHIALADELAAGPAD